MLSTCAPRTSRLQFDENFVTQAGKEVGELCSSKEDMEWGAANIHALRKTAGMTQARLAQWLGVTIKQVKHLEHQRRNPSGPTRRLLDILARQLESPSTIPVQVLGTPVPATKLDTPVTKPASPDEQSGDGAFTWE